MRGAAETSPTLLRIGEFELDRANRRLVRDGHQVALGSRYFDALVMLVDHAGELVSKDRFMDEVWRGIPVTDEALTQCIRTLRRALDDNAANPRFIETVPKHGYRFLIEPQAARAQEGKLHHVGGLPGAVVGWCTFAGLCSGMVGGGFYGLTASTGGVSAILVLAALVGALGVLAGAGLGLGMASAIAWRGRADGWLFAGGALGGLAVGALGGTLGSDGIGLLTNATIGPITGMPEGLILGSAAGLAGWMLLARGRPSPIPAVLGLAAIIGALAGLLLDASGGRLLGGSLYALQSKLGDTRLALERLGAWMGEPSFDRTSHLATAVAESAVFILVIAAGLLAARSRR